MASRFDDVDVTVTEAGAVTLADGLASFDCTIYNEVVAGDHTIVLLRLHAVEHVDPTLEPGDAVVPGPLVFHRSGFSALV